MKIFPVLILIILNFYFVNPFFCNNIIAKEKFDIKSQTKFSFNDTSVIFDKKSHLKTFGNCNPDTEECSYMKLEYEYMKNGKIKDLFNKKILDTIIFYSNMDSVVPGNIDELFTSFISVIEGEKNDMGENFRNWYIESIGKVEYINLKLISYSVTNYSYTGGAHPNSWMVFLNFDRETGELVSLRDLLIPGFDNKLNLLIEGQFRKDNDINQNEDISNNDKFSLFENKINYTNNFYITKDGISFFYNAYEIAAYVYGPIEVNIPYSKLKELIKKNNYLN
jgi:hypothetical protein